MFSSLFVVLGRYAMMRPITRTGNPAGVDLRFARRSLPVGFRATLRRPPLSAYLQKALDSRQIKSLCSLLAPHIMDFGKIDDPVDASFEAWPDDQGSSGSKFGELALSLAGVFSLEAKIAKNFKNQFLPSSRFERIKYLVDGLRIGLQMLEKSTEARCKDLEGQTSALREALKAIQAKIDTPQFEEAVATACEESARATNFQKVEQFSQILVGSLSPNPWQEPDEDVATMIRNIAQLGTGDLKALEILRKVHSTAITQNPNLHNSDAFSRETATLKRAIADSKIHPDDFLSRCERLRGFGLAAEPTRNNNQMAPDDYCYRPTRRGLALLTYLTPDERKSAAA